MRGCGSVRILLTNDDGIHAEGLVALERIARKLSDDVWVSAPEYEQSGASRALTLSEPLRIRRLEPQRYAISGTPTDCVMLAVEELMKDARPDLVLSGVNRGHNTAEDSVTMSPSARSPGRSRRMQHWKRAVDRAVAVAGVLPRRRRSPATRPRKPTRRASSSLCWRPAGRTTT